MKNTIQNKFFLSFLVFVISNNLIAQSTLGYLDFLRQVKKEHPLAKKALLIKEQGSLVVKEARGVYDPVLSTKYKEKNFDNKNYYTLFESDLSINTIAGIKLSAGYGDDQGKYLNPENFNPTGGLGYLGASIPLGKGLFFDENRLLLRGAQQVQNQLNAESDMQLNDLFFMASDAYWNWFANYFVAQNTNNSVKLATDRFNLIKKEAASGELSPNDTLKAYLQLRDRELDFLEAKRAEISSYFDLRRWIWDTTLVNQTIIPDEKSLSQSTVLAAVWSIDNNPKLNQLSSKIAEQGFERRYKIEKIKPKLNFDYSLLYNNYIPSFSRYGVDNLWGLSFQYPLFLRAERANLKMANLKIKSLEIDRQTTKNDLSLKLQNELSQLSVLETQKNQLDGMLMNYSSLLNFENIKYSIGESTLFELNAWELKMLEGQNKLVKVETKNAITYAKLFWYSNAWSTFIN